MTNHYVATVPVKYTDGEGQERTRFQRVGAMFRNTRNGDGSEFFSLKLDFPVGGPRAGDVPTKLKGTPRVNPPPRMGRPSGGPISVPEIAVAGPLRPLPSAAVTVADDRTAKQS